MDLIVIAWPTMLGLLWLAHNTTRAALDALDIATQARRSATIRRHRPGYATVPARPAHTRRTPC